MSTNQFIATRYQNGLNGGIHPARVQPETLTLQIGGVLNNAPAGAITDRLRAFSSTRNRRGAVNMRKIGLRITAGGPNDYLEGSTIYVPVMLPQTLASYLDPADQTGTYNGASVIVVGSSAEKINP